MNYELRTNKGFTLIELVVAIALLSMVLGFSSVIFKTSIEAHRTAGANSEVMQKLRAITDQLNRDFKGLQKDAPLLIWFQQDANVAEPSRYDQIMFFANGDFQAVRYPVFGNVARVYYGQANLVDYSDPNFVVKKAFFDFKTLARRQHILTADPDLYSWFDISSFVGSFVPPNNDGYEYDRVSLADWKVISDNQLYNDWVVNTCFNYRPGIDLQEADTLHMLMSEGVGSFQIQWAYWYSGLSKSSPALLVNRYLWWPSVDPDGDDIFTDSDFDKMIVDRILTNPEFGICFNMSGGVNPALYWYGPDLAASNYVSFNSSFFPKALKFTFTLYDSKGIVRNGRTFTHIVYLE